jgi:tetratricopeptide (TPR) repeat protein
MIRTLYSAFLFLAFTCSLTQAQTATSLTQSGDKKYKEKDFPAALADYTAAVKLNESAVLDYLAKNEKYSKMTTYEIALADNGRAPEPKTDWALPYFGKGLCEKELSNKPEALKDFETVIGLDPKFKEAYYERAFLKYSNDDKDSRCMDLRKAADMGYDKARTAYEDNFCWNNSLNHYKEGLTKLNIKNYDAALVEFDIALKLNPDSASTYVKRGMCYAGLTKYDMAIADFQTAIKKNEKSTEGHFQLGLAYEAKDDHQHAFEEYTKAIQINTNYYEAYLHRAQSCESQAQFASAIFDYGNAIRIHPTEAELYYKRGVLKRDSLKNDQEACVDFCKAADLGYSDADELAKNCRNPYYKKPKEQDKKKK